MYHVVIQASTRTAMWSATTWTVAHAWRGLCEHAEELVIEQRRKDYQKGDYVPPLKKDA